MFYDIEKLEGGDNVPPSKTITMNQMKTKT